MVALAVSATAAVVILAMVRSMYQHAEREQSLSREAIALGNDLVRMKMSDWREGSLQPDGEAAILLPSRDIGLPPLRVNNFSVRGETALPPVAAAHTPYQLFTFARDRYSVSFIGLALPSSTAPDAPIARPETTKSSGRP